MAQRRPAGSGRRPASRPVRTRPAARRTFGASVDGARPPGLRQTPPHLWRLAILVVLVGFLALFLTPTLRGYLDQRAEINRTHQQIAEEKARITDLERVVAQYDDDAFVERQARERLRFVKPGEVAFTVLDDTGEQLTKPMPGMAAVTNAVHQTRPWYGEVWESVSTANHGLPESDGAPRR